MGRTYPGLGPGWHMPAGVRVPSPAPLIDALALDAQSRVVHTGCGIVANSEALNRSCGSRR